MFKKTLFTLVCLSCYGMAHADISVLPVTVTASSKQVTLKWSAVPNAPFYSICYATEPVVDINQCYRYQNNLLKGTTNTSVKIGGLKNNTMYYFQVMASNESGDAYAMSASFSAKPTPAKVTARYTKISSTGSDLTASAKNWNCVRDDKTKLMWEGKTNDGGLHDTDNSYTWYQTTNNGGWEGVQNGGSCVGSDCDTTAFVQAVNAEGWCGYNDWRLPSHEELKTLMVCSSGNPSKTDLALGQYCQGSYIVPTIDTKYFPNTQYWYWSSSLVANSSYYAWVVSFKHADYWYYKRDSHSVRLVRGGQ